VVCTGVLVVLGPFNRTPATFAQILPPDVSDSCPTVVRTLTEASEDEQGRPPAQQLRAHLQDGFTGTIEIPSGMTVRLVEVTPPGEPEVPMGTLEVGSCVRIKGTRSGLDPGALIVATHRQFWRPVFEVTGQYVRIDGLRFRGPVTTDDRRAMKGSVHAIGISGTASSVQIDNNLFEFWSVGVTVFRGWPQDFTCQEKAPLVSITRNYFNRNAVDQLGYGVGVFRGCAKIEGNLFNKNRHAVAASGDVMDENEVWHGKGYVARYNYVLEGGFTECDLGCYWNQHFDVHGTGAGGYGGTGGEYFLIAWNTIRGEQTYSLGMTRAAFMLRGQPLNAAIFHDNVVVHNDMDDAVRIKGAYPECAVFVPAGVEYSHELCRLFVFPNRYDTDTKAELAAGDFDGDGRDDIFLANGTAWWYSSAGRTEWRFLQPSTLGIKDLRFGRFDADARTDVLFSHGSRWFMASGGARLPRVWRTDGKRLNDCVFGRFDDDGFTDAACLESSLWYLAPGGNGAWIGQIRSNVRADRVRVGDFTFDGQDDVFWIANDNTWTVWDVAGSAVKRRHDMPVVHADMDTLVVADFDGDGGADLAKSTGTTWSWLRGGTNFWAPLRDEGGQPEYWNIRSAVLGRFTAGDQWLDAVRYASNRFDAPSKYGFAIWNGTQHSFTPWSPAWQEMR
jgi:hypothetical protein